MDRLQAARRIGSFSIGLLVIGTGLAMLAIAHRFPPIAATLAYLVGFFSAFVAFFARLGVPRAERGPTWPAMVASILAWVTFALINITLRRGWLS